MSDRTNVRSYEGTTKLLGAFFFAEGPLGKNTFGRMICKQTQVYAEGICRSYNPGSFGMMTRLEMRAAPT
jgi:hypothetical protein